MLQLSKGFWMLIREWIVGMSKEKFLCLEIKRKNESNASSSTKCKLHDLRERFSNEGSREIKSTTNETEKHDMNEMSKQVKRSKENAFAREWITEDVKIFPAKLRHSTAGKYFWLNISSISAFVSALPEMSIDFVEVFHSWKRNWKNVCNSLAWRKIDLKLIKPTWESSSFRRSKILLSGNWPLKFDFGF